jgi:sterol desaturase/sphingolipid hydroxylase (fatty acid hydroxylase superfamily)
MLYIVKTYNSHLKLMVVSYKHMAQKSKMSTAELKKTVTNKPAASSRSLNVHQIVYIVLLVFAALMPLAGWAIGANINPSGWMSDDPVMSYVLILILVSHYWYYAIGAVILFFCIEYFLVKDSGSGIVFKLASIFIFILSLIYSIFLMTIVKDANSSEFTG